MTMVLGDHATRGIPLACVYTCALGAAAAAVAVAMLLPTGMHYLADYGGHTTTGHYGRTMVQPGEFWAAGPHYTLPPHQPVPREVWEPDKPFVDWLLQRRHRSPVILTNTLASRWRASQRWSPEYLSHHLSSSSFGVRSSSHPVFQYYNSELSSKTEALHADHLVDREHSQPPPGPVLENMTMAEFCAQPQAWTR